MAYHINPRSGDPGYCKATEGRCPFASANDHYETKDQARKAYEKIMNDSMHPFAKQEPAVMIHLNVDPDFKRGENGYVYVASGWDVPYITEEYSVYVNYDDAAATADVVIIDEDGIPLVRALVEPKDMPKALDALAFRADLKRDVPQATDDDLDKLYENFLKAGGRSWEDHRAVSLLYRAHKIAGNTDVVLNRSATRKNKAYSLEERFGSEAAALAKRVAENF